MNRSLLAAAALAAAVAVAWVGPQDSGKPDPKPAGGQQAGQGEAPRGRGQGRHHEEETPLSRQMEQLDRAMHVLKRTLRGATGPLTAEQRDDCLKQVADAQQACVAAKLLVPKMAAHQKDDERPAFVSDFRKGVARLLIEWTNLEVALLDNDKDTALASYKKLEAMEDDGHSNFTDE